MTKTQDSTTLISNSRSSLDALIKPWWFNSRTREKLQTLILIIFRINQLVSLIKCQKKWWLVTLTSSLSQWWCFQLCCFVCHSFPFDTQDTLLWSFNISTILNALFVKEFLHCYFNTSLNTSSTTGVSLRRSYKTLTGMNSSWQTLLTKP